MSLNLAFPLRTPVHLQLHQDAMLLQLQAQQTVNQLHDSLRELDYCLTSSRALLTQLELPTELSSELLFPRTRLGSL